MQITDDLFKKLEDEFDKTDVGSNFNNELTDLDNKHDILSKQVKDLNSKKRSNRYEYKKLQNALVDAKNNYVLDRIKELIKDENSKKSTNSNLSSNSKSVQKNTESGLDLSTENEKKMKDSSDGFI